MYLHELKDHLAMGGKIRVPNWEDDMYMTKDADSVSYNAWDKRNQTNPISYFLSVRDIEEVDVWEKVIE